MRCKFLSQGDWFDGPKGDVSPITEELDVVIAVMLKRAQMWHQSPVIQYVAYETYIDEARRA